MELHKIITINIFTNCCLTSPNTILIKKLLESMQTIFKILLERFRVNIFVDYHPYEDKYDEYVNNIRNMLKKFNINNYKIFKTNGLAYSHFKSVKVSKTPILFQLEHDWTFSNTIINSLDDLINIMTNHNIDCIQFNKGINERITYGGLKEININNISFSYDNYIANMPFLIVRDNAKERMKYIRFAKGSSKGVEYELTKTGLFRNYLYGPINYPPTIIHEDGRSIDHNIID